MSVEVQPLVTVIVPVYNVEKYVEECIGSIINQTYQNLEIVIVDDGSTDESGHLCKTFAREDNRVAYYHKANGGLSDARNFGLSRCHGEWVSFVDSDDYISPIFIEIMLKAAIESECLMSAVPCGKSFKDGCTCELASECGTGVNVAQLCSYDIQRLMLYQTLATGVPWRLYKRELLGDEPFPKGLLYEDLASVYKIIHKIERVALVDCCDLYAYRMRKDSIIRQKYSHAKAESALIVANQLYEDICTWYPELSAAAASRCFSVCRMVFAQVPTGKVSTEKTNCDRDALWAVLKQHRFTVLHDLHARKRERLAAAIAYLGKEPFSIFCMLCRKMGKMQ